MKKALAAGGQATGEGTFMGENQLENTQQQGYTDAKESNVRHSLKGYWYPNLTKSELKNLRQQVRVDIKTSQNNINGRANWYLTWIGGKPVFAIYSTADASDPTILYAEKGDQATYEQNLLKDALEDFENGESINGKSGVINRVLGRSWVRQSGGNTGTAGAVGGGRYSGNVGVLRKQPQRNSSAAFENVLRNILEAQESDRTVKYSRKLSDQERVRNAAEAAGYTIHAFFRENRKN